jgi:CMP-N-acetylneuraminic acid synthetase
MKFKNEFWAFIPARSGSKGLKNKNIKKLCGLPLISYSIRTALRCKKIKKTVFSSDSLKYLKLAKNYGCKDFHLRSKIISSDKSSELSVFQDFLKKRIKENLPIPLYLVHLRPTTPIRKLQTLYKSINYFKKITNQSSSLRTVTLLSNPAFRYSRIINKKLCALTKKDFNLDKWFRPRQFFPKTYISNAIIDIYKSKNILKGFLFGNKVRPYIIKDLYNDIDSIEDFRLVEYYIKNKSNLF